MDKRLFDMMIDSLVEEYHSVVSVGDTVSAGAVLADIVTLIAEREAQDFLRKQMN